MDEPEIRAAVNKLIADNNLAAEIVECDEDDGWPTVRVEVERKDYERAIMVDSYLDCVSGTRFSVSWRQKVPELVGAEVGDLVLIFNEHHAQDADSDVGLVSSKFTEEESGDVYYGCRYINIALNNSFVNNIYDFELTEENYGGYPMGFLRVLSLQEAEDHLRSQLDVALKKELESAQTKYDKSVKNLPELLAALGTGKKVKCDKLDVDELNFPFSLSVKK